MGVMSFATLLGLLVNIILYSAIAYVTIAPILVVYFVIKEKKK